MTEQTPPRDVLEQARDLAQTLGEGGVARLFAYHLGEHHTDGFCPLVNLADCPIVFTAQTFLTEYQPNTPAPSTPDTDLRDRALEAAKTAVGGSYFPYAAFLSADAVLAVVQPELDRRDAENEQLRRAGAVCAAPAVIAEPCGAEPLRGLKCQLPSQHGGRHGCWMPNGNRATWPNERGGGAPC